jgi:glycosyltransferase involved in cell wall biosynthesis
MSGHSIFREYFKDKKLEDRFKKDKEKAVDVIIPLFNSNVLWRTNLLSFYREIPIKTLIVGDGGSTDDSVAVVKEFPRVNIIDQKNYRSLGYCIRKLIEMVETEYFIYLHSDVWLPNGWFDKMYAYKNTYDWFECYRRITILFEYEEQRQNMAERPYSGSQFGRTAAFRELLPNIEDDYLYRNEDIIFMELLKKFGGRYFRIPDTYHYHQIMNRKGEKEPKTKSVSIVREYDPDWEVRMLNMQARGIIKYLEPKGYLKDSVNAPLRALDRIERLNWKEFCKWVKETNPIWLRYIKNPHSLPKKVMDGMIRVGKRILRKYS